jgi:Rap1a immunity proteins
MVRQRRGTFTRRSRRKRVLEGILVSEAGVQHAKSPLVSNSLKTIPGILTFLLVITSLPALAGQMTVSNLREVCSRSDKDSKKSCDYYILGVAEGINKAATLIGDKKIFCIPESVSLITLESLIKKTIEEDLMVYPADRDLAAVAFVLEATQKAYPCRGAG